MIHQFSCVNCKGVYYDSSREGGTYHHACPPLPEKAAAATAKAWNPRNENIAPIKGMRPAEIVSEGLGVKCLTSKTLKEPAWITGLKKAAAKANGEES